MLDMVILQLFPIYDTKGDRVVGTFNLVPESQDLETLNSRNTKILGFRQLSRYSEH